MILDTLEVHSNWWIYLYTMELLFSSFFTDQNLTPILNKNQSRSCDENTTWWRSTFWANYIGEWECPKVQESGKKKTWISALVIAILLLNNVESKQQTSKQTIDLNRLIANFNGNSSETHVPSNVNASKRLLKATRWLLHFTIALTTCLYLSF